MKHVSEGLEYSTPDPIKPHIEYDLFSSILRFIACKTPIILAFDIYMYICINDFYFVCMVVCICVLDGSENNLGNQLSSSAFFETGRVSLLLLVTAVYVQPSCPVSFCGVFCLPLHLDMELQRHLPYPDVLELQEFELRPSGLPNMCLTH